MLTHLIYFLLYTHTVASAPIMHSLYPLTQTSLNILLWCPNPLCSYIVRYKLSLFIKQVRNE